MHLASPAADTVSMSVSQTEWIVTIGVTVAVLLFDVIVVARKPHEPTLKECAIYLAGLRRPGDRLRHLGHGAPRRRPEGRRLRSAVLRRLADRVQPVDRQPVHLPDHHGELQGAEEAAAGGPAGRHHHRAGVPRHLHRARRGRDQQLLVDLLHLRRVPALDRVDAGQGHRARRRRRERRSYASLAATSTSRTSGTVSSSSSRRTRRPSSRRCSW